MPGQVTTSNAAFQTLLLGGKFETADAITQLFTSISVAPNTAVLLNMTLVCRDLGSSAALVAKARVLFGRAAVTLVRAAAPNVDLIANTFGAPAPSVDAVVNGGSIDITYTGKASTDLRWWLQVEQVVTQ